LRYLCFEALSKICKNNYKFRHVHLSVCSSAVRPSVSSARIEQMKSDMSIFQNMKKIQVSLK